MTSIEENTDYLTSQLITYIGNKRSLLEFIGKGLALVRQRLGKTRLSLFDVFSGSGIVSRYFKRHTSFLVVNDLEHYAEIINRCYLADPDSHTLKKLREIYLQLRSRLDEGPLEPGIISTHYAPRDDMHIQHGERVFYTSRNASYIDTARRLMDGIDKDLRCFFLAPLMSEASIHANTAGVFKGFYKCAKSGLGQFGGTGRDALHRITGDITLPFPLFSSFPCNTLILRGDSNKVAEKVPEVDLAYLDPPYNQHPYGSNYFMLNLIADYTEPVNPSSVSGIPENWNRSSYNKRRDAEHAFSVLVDTLKAKFLLVSFNSEGFISRETMLRILSRTGDVEVLETGYNVFRGSRNLRNRNIYVKEYLYLVEKK